MSRFDDALLERLRTSAPLPGMIGRSVALKRAGKSWAGLCPFHGERTPSFHVYEDHFHCFGCGARGDAIAWVMRRNGMSFPAAVESLAGELGLDLPDRPRHAPRPAAAPPPLAAPPREPSAEEQEELAGRIEAARQMWLRAGPVGDVVRAYLDSRGLWPLPDAAHLVLREAQLRHPQTQRTHPVMLARVDGPNGVPSGVHRTYLTAEGRKLDGVNAKLTLGALSGAAIRLCPLAPCLGYAEGIETALAAARLTGMGAWACISAGVLAQQTPPMDVTRAVIFADRDLPKGRPEGAGLMAARVLAARLKSQGVAHDIRLPNEPWGDYADALLALQSAA